MKQTIEEARALHNLANGISWSYTHEDGVVWGSDTIPQPTQEEIDAEIVRFTAEDAGLQYQRERVYPGITDQLDQLYWDKKNGTNHWEEGIDAVKAAHPKP